MRSIEKVSIESGGTDNYAPHEEPMADIRDEKLDESIDAAYARGRQDGRADRPTCATCRWLRGKEPNSHQRGYHYCTNPDHRVVDAVMASPDLMGCRLHAAKEPQ